MKPTPEEIRKAVPGTDTDDQVVYVEKEEMVASGFIETFTIRISNILVKVFRSQKIRKVIFAVVMGAAAVDGTQVCSLPEPKAAELKVEIADQDRWLQSVATYRTPQTDNQYFVLGGPGNPSPIDATFNAPEVTIMAPISGALGLATDERFTVYQLDDSLG